MSMPTTDRALPKTAWVKWPFAASELKNGFAPDEWLQTSAQDLVPELRVGNMPGVRSHIIEIEICSRSHCRFPPVEKQTLLASSQQPIASRLSFGNAYCGSTLSRHRDSKVSTSFSARACASNGLPGLWVATPVTFPLETGCADTSFGHSSSSRQSRLPNCAHRSPKVTLMRHVPLTA